MNAHAAISLRNFLMALCLAWIGLQLFMLIWRRRLSGWFLLTLSLIPLGLAALIAESCRGQFHWGEALLFSLLLGLGFFLAVKGIARMLRPATPGRRQAKCPPIDLLKGLLEERLTPAENAQLAAHLEVCPTCQHRFEGLTAGQQSWPGIARKLTPPPPPEPALQKVMQDLKGQPEPELTRDAPVFTADLPLSFLSPADKPGLLGRLERYEVLEEVGRGGMGVVLKAFDPSLHRVVAIKVLAPQLATSGVARKRFLREAKAAAAVTHDHIVTIHAVEESNGLPYLVMQYVAGQSLQDRIDKEGPLELSEVLRIGVQTAAGLAAAHAHGIVHRDIKPANILLEDGVQRVKITDFGLARAMDDASLTQSGFVAGSPLYMAPEQARGEALDQRADLFSLGSVLYTLCTGRPPFRAGNTLAVLRRVSEDAPRPIRETNPEVPDWLAALIARLMAKDPAERFQSAGEVESLLAQHLAQLHQPDQTPAPAPAAANLNAGLPTSVTLCPNCGASLHVPETLVGSVVHCQECGKPFQVEDGSEVIQVARSVPPPLGPGFRPRHKLPRWALLAGGCFALLLLLFLLVGFSVQQSRLAVAAKSGEARIAVGKNEGQPLAFTALTDPKGEFEKAWIYPSAFTSDKSSLTFQRGNGVQSPLDHPTAGRTLYYYYTVPEDFEKVVAFYDDRLAAVYNIPAEHRLTLPGKEGLRHGFWGARSWEYKYFVEPEQLPAGGAAVAVTLSVRSTLDSLSVFIRKRGNDKRPATVATLIYDPPTPGK